MECNLCSANESEALPFHYLWEGKTFRGRRCRNCGLIALDPLPTDAELARLYDAGYFESGLHGLDKAGLDYETLTDDKAVADRGFIRRVIGSRHPDAKSLFEVGAAMGHFLAVAREAGFHVDGLEFSPPAVERAGAKFGLDLMCGNIETADLSDRLGAWDVVYAGDLLEHLRDPSAALAKMRALLAPGGICVVVLPGTFNLLATRLATSVYARLGRDKRLPDKPYHLYEYTIETARRMFEAHFGRVEIICEASPPRALNLKNRSADYLAKYLLQFLNYPLTRLTGRFGDRMTVIARP